MNELARENIAIGFLSLIVMFSAYLLFGNAHIFESRKSSDYFIARLVNSSNTVRYRSAKELFWRDAYDDIELSKEDQVFTHENSSAVIKFLRGVELFIGPEALIKVETQNNEPVLKVARGTIYGSGSNKGSVTLNTGSSRIRLDGKTSRFQISAGEDGQGEQIAVFGSRAQVSVGGKEYQLGKNQVVKSDKNGKVKIKTMEIEPLSPSTDQEKNTSNSSVLFSWKAPNKYKQFEVIVSADPQFTSPIVQKKVGVQKAELKVSGAQDGYYWKVRAGKIESLPQYFKLASDIAPTALFPIEDQVFTINKEKVLDQVRLAWESEKAADAFDVDVATDANFEKMVQSQIGLREKYYPVKDLPSGKYYWRIRQTVANKQSRWSDTQQFYVLQPRFVMETIYPINDVVVRNDTIQFIWSKPTFASYYQFVMYGDSTKKQKIAQQESETESVEQLIPGSGRLYWQVTAFDKNGDKVGESQLESFVKK